MSAMQYVNTDANWLTAGYLGSAFIGGLLIFLGFNVLVS